jgi:hypothetical protein
VFSLVRMGLYKILPLNSGQNPTCDSFLIAFMHQGRSADYSTA